MKNTGAALTVMGVISLITSNVIENNTLPHNGPGKASNSYSNESNIWRVSGVVCLGVGIPLWIADAANKKDTMPNLTAFLSDLIQTPGEEG